MVYLVADQICIYQYCCIYDCSTSVCVVWRRICFVCSLVMIIYSLIQYFRGHAIEGYTTTILLLLLIGSAIMLSLGVIGYYLAKIYEEVKRRPRYIVSQIIHGNKDVTGSVRDDA